MRSRSRQSPRRSLSRARLLLVGVPALLAAAGCERHYTLFPDNDAARVDSSLSWGRYTASLDLPQCPAGAPLVVDTASAELEGGQTLADPAQAGAALSFVEAMWIAANRPGQDNITFDPTVFPADTPTTITIPTTTAFPIDLSEACVDGRDRGVVVQWEEGSYYNGLVFGRSLVMGLTLLALPHELEISDSQLAACRINTDGHGLIVQSVSRFWAVNVGRNAVLGPHNVVAHRNFGARTNGADTTIRGNYFGYDPVTHQRIELGTAIDLLVFRVAITDNVFAGSRDPIDTGLGSSEPDIAVRGNYIGVTPEGAPIPGPHAGLSLGHGHGTIGPGNVIRGTDTAISLGPTTRYRITRNVISGNQAGIVFVDGAPTAAPTLTFASSTQVQGTCPVAGTVEIFADPADQAEHYLGEATCAAGGSFTAAVAPPAGAADLFVTATLTSDTEGLTSALSPALAMVR